MASFTASKSSSMVEDSGQVVGALVVPLAGLWVRKMGQWLAGLWER